MRTAIVGLWKAASICALPCLHESKNACFLFPLSQEIICLLKSTRQFLKKAESQVTIFEAATDIEGSASEAGFPLYALFSECAQCLMDTVLQEHSQGPPGTFAYAVSQPTLSSRHGMAVLLSKPMLVILIMTRLHLPY